MNSKILKTLGNLNQQRAALPLLIYRDGVRIAPTRITKQVFGLALRPVTPVASDNSDQAGSTTPALAAAEVAHSSISNSNDVAPSSASRADAASTRKPKPTAGIMRMLSLLGLFAIGGCASFTQPMTDMELRAESDSCAKSALCRTFIEDKPPVLALAVNDARLCETNARVAENILAREGISTRRFVVKLKPSNRRDFQTEGAQSQLVHTFVAANVNKRWYAVDNGALPFCNRVCRLDEALHGVEIISGNTKQNVEVGEAVLAGR